MGSHEVSCARMVRAMNASTAAVDGETKSTTLGQMADPKMPKDGRRKGKDKKEDLGKDWQVGRKPRVQRRRGTEGRSGAPGGARGAAAVSETRGA